MTLHQATRVVVLPLAVLCLQCSAAQKPSPRAASIPTLGAGEPALRPAARMLPATRPAPPPAAEPLRDAQIAAVLAAINQSEIAQARVARQKTSDTRIDQLAEAIIARHAKLQNELVKTATFLGLQAENSRLLARLDEDAQAGSVALAPLTGVDFDAAYVDTQISERNHAVEALDTWVIPAVQAPELSDLALKTRAAVMADLSAVESVRRALVR